ncbi:Bgt-1627 [Blumeria graminis f. sp. tritici]|uniref:Bgt-1627 n=2 Tax=Blumeria graminis f. sp. tritici TaxID=62690 RepID=A0A381LB85_BLUGR|nr:NADH-ubiquinone oxidoreductase [Blumeria graminis f. sp. tritici 96224]VDB89839.1 Bgt-1627 [Blumeria graminis f. sp. tritici]
MSSKYMFSQSLRELRFLFCQTSGESGPVRSFISRAYPVMKKSNPNIPIMIREAAGTHPRIFARYELGVERSISLSGLSDKEIDEKVSDLVNVKA